jgi:hypothetical protein
LNLLIVILDSAFNHWDRLLALLDVCQNQNPQGGIILSLHDPTDKIGRATREEELPNSLLKFSCRPDIFLSL